MTNFILLNSQLNIVIISAIAVSLFFVIVVVVFYFYKYLTTTKELEIEGSFVTITDTEVPIIQFQTFTGDLSTPTVVLLPFKPADKDYYVLHVYELVIETSGGEKVSMEIESKLIQSVKNHVERFGKKMKVHCTKLLWSDKLQMDYVLS